MKRCADVEPLFAPYVDGQVEPSAAAEVASHLDACPPCRAHVEGERAARALVQERRKALCDTAPHALRTRCAAACARRRIGAARWVPLSAVAALLLAVTGMFVVGSFDRGTPALAAQLTLDHVTCFKMLRPDGQTDAAALAANWQRTQGWALRVPPSQGALELLGVRACLSSEGRTAHIMYRHDGRPLSLFVARDATRTARSLEAMGHQTILWSDGDRLFALVGQEPRGELESVAAYVRNTATRRPE